ncbi:MAG: hypothetical protein ABIO72_00650 [Patescibacteria group bacterium]
MSEPTTEAAQPTMTVETPKEQRLETLTPDKRAELVAKSEELRRAATDIEARKQEASAAQARDESETATIQERINATLGTHDVLNIVREEDKALLAIYEKQLQSVKGSLASIEKKLSAPTSAPEVSAPTPEAPVAETAKDLTPDLTTESATIINKPVEVVAPAVTPERSPEPGV